MNGVRTVRGPRKTTAKNCNYFGTNIHCYCTIWPVPILTIRFGGSFCLAGGADSMDTRTAWRLLVLFTTVLSNLSRTCAKVFFLLFLLPKNQERILFRALTRTRTLQSIHVGFHSYTNREQHFNYNAMRCMK